ncbi:MAG: nucleotidyltransferase family protein, partial [Actinomycetota bacterium]|nr:nucleotidyltransferase family protein [Actinomycetota bacterium]
MPIHRLTGLLQAAIDGGALPVTESQVQEAKAAHASAMLWVLRLERELLAVSDLLTEATIETRVLKGAAVAHLDYSRPEQRSFIDLDILVRGEHFDRAVQTLIAAGFVRPLQEPRPGFDRRFDKGTTLVAPAGYELDLHRTFVLGPWGLLVDLDDLWGDDGQEFVVGGHRLRALSHHYRLLHACYHAALGNWPLRLASLRDVAEMVLATGYAETDIRTLASRWQVEAVVAAAIADAWRLLGLPSTEVSAWAQRYVPSRQDEAKLNLYT